MITDFPECGLPARSSARRSPGRPRPPMASPPSVRNDRREMPSQNRRCGPNRVNMTEFSWEGGGPYAGRLHDQYSWRWEARKWNSAWEYHQLASLTSAIWVARPESAKGVGG